MKINEFLSNKIVKYTLYILGLIFGVLVIVLPQNAFSGLSVIAIITFLGYGGILFFAYCISSSVFENVKVEISAIISILLGILLLFVNNFLIIAILIILLLNLIGKSIYYFKQIKNFKSLEFCEIIIQGVMIVASLILLILSKIVLSRIFVGGAVVLEMLKLIYEQYKTKERKI